MLSKRSVAAALSSVAVVTSIVMAAPAIAADMPIPMKAPPPPASCGSVYDFFFTACPLTWYGVTWYGTVDMGGSYMTHGAPFDPNFPTGVPYLIGGGGTGATGRLPGFFLAPNAMSQSNVGVKINEPVVGGWSFVAQGELAFDPYSFLLSNAPQAMQNAIGTAQNQEESPIDSSRWGWLAGPVNGGVSHPVFGTLTFGRMNAFYNDAIVAYDPMGASYAFSPIGFSGKSAGAGDTEEARWTTAIKYRVNVGDWRFGVQGQPLGYGAFNPNNGAVEGDVGTDIKHLVPGVISVDVEAAWIKDAVNIAPAYPGQSLNSNGWPNVPFSAAAFPANAMLGAKLSNQASFYIFTKYDIHPYVPMTFYAGYEWIDFTNPSDPQTAFRDDGFLFAAVNASGATPGAGAFRGNGTFINNNGFNNAFAVENEIFQVMWIGTKYGITKNLDIIGAYYHYIQSNYNLAAGTLCNPATGTSLANKSNCAGWLDAASWVLDWRFLPKWDWYIGMMYSAEFGGLANGSITRNNYSEVTGVRFKF